jgi:hypothetical protein
MDEKQNSNRERDISTLRVLGAFFAVMGGLVLLATYEAIGNTPAVVVNVCCGLVLSAVGLGMLIVANRLSR